MWNQLSVNTVHLLYVAISAFLCLFLLFSSFIKERLYFGEANVALLVGAILGPSASKAVDPNVWTHFDNVVLEFSRVVLIIQCFAVALQLPKHYIEKHWISLLWLVGPVVAYGWMVCSLLVWWMIPTLSWTQSMSIASCFNAIDPVMAATIVGRGKFARRVPKHTRDLLMAESATNDVTTSVAVGLSILLTRFPGTAGQAAQSLFLYTIAYQILLAGSFGLVLGFLAQYALRYAYVNEKTDRGSFLSFYVMMALFCAGLGSILGVDDVLLAFCAGYTFDSQGWFSEKTEETHVSGSIELLLNLTFFVFLGSMIPWHSFNQKDLGVSAWRLVICTLCILFLRRIPIVLMLKPVIPDIKTWREALFYGHFGPIGVGAIFSAALISSEPGRTGIAGNLLAVSPDDNMQNAIWPVVTFVVLCSSIVHGSSIPLFTLVKFFNTLTLTISYSTAKEDGPSWMSRLPKIADEAKSMSKQSLDSEDFNIESIQYPPGTLPPIGFPGNFLRRQREEDNDASSYSSRQVRRRRGTRDAYVLRDHISDSAIRPARRARSDDIELDKMDPVSVNESRPRSLEIGQTEDAVSRSTFQKSQVQLQRRIDRPNSDVRFHHDHTETCMDGNELHIEEDDENDVTMQTTTSKDDSKPAAGETSPEITEVESLSTYQILQKKFAIWADKGDITWPRLKKKGENSEREAYSMSRKRGPALAYQFGNTIIIEDEDGEVIKKYDLPQEQPSSKLRTDRNKGDDEDRRIRFTRGGAGRKLTKEDFLKEIQSLDPQARIESRNSNLIPQALIREHDETGATENLQIPPIPLPSRYEAETPAEKRRREAALRTYRTSNATDSDDSSYIDQTSSISPSFNVLGLEPQGGTSIARTHRQGTKAKSCLKIPTPEVIVTSPDSEDPSLSFYMSGALQDSPGIPQAERSPSPKGKERRVSFEE